MSALPTPQRVRPVAPPASGSRGGRPAAGAQETRRRPKLRVVGPVRHVRRYTVLVTLVMALGVFGIVSLNALAAEAAFQARSLEEQVERLSIRYELLTARVAELEAPKRVRHVATTKLGMVPADQPAYLVLEPAVGGVAERPGDPRDRREVAAVVVADRVKQAMSLQR